LATNRQIRKPFSGNNIVRGPESMSDVIGEIDSLSPFTESSFVVVVVCVRVSQCIYLFVFFLFVLLWFSV
jgi:hypothetical protein